MFFYNKFVLNFRELYEIFSQDHSIEPPMTIFPTSNNVSSNIESCVIEKELEDASKLYNMRKTAKKGKTIHYSKKTLELR